MLFPLLVGLDGYALQPEHARIVGALSDAGLRVVDLLLLLRGREASELWVHESDHHPNELVHELAGEALANAIERALATGAQGSR